MPGWEELGMQTASNVANGVLGLALGGINDRRQLKQQEKLQNLQITGSKQLTDYNFQKQMELWKNTNYPAQMAMLKQAGLNPALIYDHGGGQASTSISTGNVSGANAPVGGGEAQAIMAMGLQRQMMQAQVDLTKAQTEKTKAETQNVPLTGQQIEAQTGNLLQGINNQKAQEALTKVQTTLTDLQTQFANETMKDRAATINLGLSKLIEETRIMENERGISDATKADKIKLIGNQVSNMAMDTLLKQQQAAKTEEEKNKVTQEIQNLKQAWDINAIDQEMSKDGINPHAGSLMKIFHNLLRLIGQNLGL